MGELLGVDEVLPEELSIEPEPINEEEDKLERKEPTPNEPPPVVTGVFPEREGESVELERKRE